MNPQLGGDMAFVCFEKQADSTRLDLCLFNFIDLIR